MDTAFEEEFFAMGVTNLRRLKDVSPVVIRPITILVGRNTSGKSSFLRTIPLLRQSLMTRMRSPLLWYGDLVDFGSFDGVIHDNNSELPLGFRFSIGSVQIRNNRARMSDGEERSRFRIGRVDVDFNVNKAGANTKISHIQMSLVDVGHNVTFHIGNRNITKIVFDGEDVTKVFDAYRIVVEDGSIFPNLLVWRRDHPDDIPTYTYNAHDLLFSSLFSALVSALPKTVSEEKIRRMVVDLTSFWPVDQGILARFFENSDLRSVQRIGEKIARGENKAQSDDVLKLLRLNKIFLVLIGVLEGVQNLFLRSLYIGPARAAGQRYYRYQDLSVSEIDPDGKNFPMFLNSLSYPQISSFSEWVSRLFGFGVGIDRSAGHISIEVVTSNGRTNVADTGYGVSQVLPVLGQIWWAQQRSDQRQAKRQRAAPRLMRSLTKTTLLAIEQPELHLHPAHQALIADALAGVLAGRDEANVVQLYCVVETHSESLINRLGELVAEKSLRAADVQIVIFEMDRHDSRASTVSVATFNEEGVLQNWPYDFFLAGRVC